MTPVLIKKYPNRKLYITKGNTETSGYTSLSKIVKILKAGKDVKILDDESGEDITVTTLKSALDKVEISYETLVGLIRGE